MNILAIDTSGPVCGTAVRTDAGIRASSMVLNQRTHSVNLMPMVDTVLQAAGLTLAEGIAFTLDEPYLGDRIAAKKGELQLIYFVNGVIDEVLEDGTYIRWIEEAQKRADELGL